MMYADLQPGDVIVSKRFVTVVVHVGLAIVPSSLTWLSTRNEHVQLERLAHPIDLIVDHAVVLRHGRKIYEA